jgi:hypothetical protein
MINPFKIHLTMLGRHAIRETLGGVLNSFLAALQIL